MGRCDRLGLHVHSMTTILNPVLVLFSEYRSWWQAPLQNAFDIDTIYFSRCNMDYKYLFIGSDPWSGLACEKIYVGIVSSHQTYIDAANSEAGQSLSLSRKTPPHQLIYSLSLPPLSPRTTRSPIIQLDMFLQRTPVCSLEFLRSVKIDTYWRVISYKLFLHIGCTYSC